MRILSANNAALTPSGYALGLGQVTSIETTLAFGGDATWGDSILNITTRPAVINGLYLVCASYVVTVTTLATGTGTGRINWTDQVGARVFDFHMGTLDMTGTNTIFEEMTIQTGPSVLPVQTSLQLTGWSAGAATVVLRAAVLRLR